MIHGAKDWSFVLTIVTIIAVGYARFNSLEEAKANAVVVNGAQDGAIEKLKSQIAQIESDRRIDVEITKLSVEIAGLRVQVDGFSKQLNERRKRE